MPNTRCRVLFIDDDKVDQMAFTRLVQEQKLPYDALIAGSVAEARKALDEGSFDIVIADYRLGDGTAFDVIEYVKSTPVIFVTGAGSEEIAVRALRTGAADYLIKDRERNYLKLLPAAVEHSLARVKAEEQVRKLSKALELSPDVVMITDSAGGIEYVNPGFTVVTGYNTKEVLGQNPRILKSGEHPPEFYKQLWDTIKTGQVWRGEFHNRKRNGALYWERASISPMRNAEGTITHYVAVKEDVTERKQAEALLLESEENFRALAENAYDGILISTGEGRNAYANRRVAEMSGYSTEELLRMQLSDLAHPDERKKLQDLFQRRLSGEAVLERYETIMLRKDGTHVPAELGAALTTWRGQPAVMQFIRDITDRRRAEQALYESEEKYRNLVERASDGIALIQDNVVRYANQRLAEMGGWSASEVVGKPFIEYVRPDERARVVQRYQRRLRGEAVPSSYETVLRGKDGSSVHAELSAGVVSYEGKPTDLVVVRDITERKRAEAELADRNARLRMMVEQVPAILWTTDMEMKFTSSVGAALPRLGLVPGQVVGMSLYEFFNTQDPEHLAIAAHRRALNGEHTTYVLEWGDDAWDSDVEPLYDPQGRIIGTIGVAQDITPMVKAEKALEESEENFKALAANAHDGILIAAGDRGHLYANARAAEITGYTVEELLNVGIRDLARPLELPSLRERLEKRLRGEPVVSQYEVVVRRKDRQEIPLEVTWGRTLWRGQPAVMMVLRDVTDRKQAERERENLIQELDAFAHTVAHDLKGPLTTILGFTELAQRDPASLPRAELEQDLGMIHQGAEKMKTIIDELLLLAGVRKSDVVLKPLDMGSVVSGALQRLSYIVEERRPEVVMPGSWPPALGHGPWVEEVWANYLSNAIKYGGAPPRLELGGDMVGDATVRFWVRDNGPGLTPEEQQRLFMPFTRLHQVDTAGQGLGLSIVRRIMEKLGGEAWVESTPGRGSTFGFTLPRASGPEEPTAPRASPSAQRSTS
jgi:PAS domain S-box-containing protein